VAGGRDPRSLSQCIREVWTYRDGLPHNVVHRVLAASTGYLWIGTQEGLVRFDGARFKVFARRETPGLVGDEINALLEDEHGILWIGTPYGLSRLRGDAFEIVGLGGDVSVSALAPDGEGGVWVATEAGGVRHVRAGKAALVERLVGLPDERVTSLWRGSGNDLWIGGQGGLARLVEGRLELPGKGGLPSEVVRAVVQDRDGVVWVGTARGLARRRPGAGAFERVAFVGEADVYALLQDHEGGLWVGTGGGPLLRIVGEQVEPLTGSEGVPDVHTLAEDAEGNIWVGTETGGLFRLRWGQVETVAREEGLSADVVWAVREGRGGVVWVASDGGLDRIAGGRAEPAYAEQLRGTGVAALFEDRAGGLWVGTNRAGLVRFGPRSVERYGADDGLARSMARAVHEDARGTIWVGTNRGLFRMIGGRFHALARDPALAGDKVNTIAERADGSLWVGTTTGLARVEDRRLVPAPAAGQSIRSDVAALRADPDGSLWIGSVGDGLARLSGGRLDRWTRREGLHEDTVLAILDDGLGHLWLSGNRGITRVRRSELNEVATGRRAAVAPTVLGTADGMRERECNGGVQPAAWRASDGRLWFATIRGVVVVDPARVRANPTPPPARIEELAVDGHPLPQGDSLRFRPGTRRVDIRYTGLALAAADRIRFRHRLDGLEEAFFDAGGERVARYTNLGPGRYLFQVAAANETGVWGAAASLGFEIEPYPWQTSWFYLAAGLSAAALGLGAHRLRTRGLRRHEAELAIRVEEEVRKVKVLAGFLPTCAWCKRIRDDAGGWHRWEAYVSARTDAQFTHGICPECYARAVEGKGEG
jgi:ligand-binding sensor domain-containing protein